MKISILLSVPFHEGKVPKLREEMVSITCFIFDPECEIFWRKEILLMEMKSIAMLEYVIIVS